MSTSVWQTEPDIFSALGTSLSKTLSKQLMVFDVKRMS
jgi:hypothetical protein